MLKMTALVSVIAAHDLMSNIQDVYGQNYQVIPMLVVASPLSLDGPTLLDLRAALGAMSTGAAPAPNSAEPPSQGLYDAGNRAVLALSREDPQKFA